MYIYVTKWQQRNRSIYWYVLINILIHNRSQDLNLSNSVTLSVWRTEIDNVTVCGLEKWYIDLVLTLVAFWWTPLMVSMWQPMSAFKCFTKIDSDSCHIDWSYRPAIDQSINSSIAFVKEINGTVSFQHSTSPFAVAMLVCLKKLFFQCWLNALCNETVCLFSISVTLWSL